MSKSLIEKWKPILESEDFAPIRDRKRMQVTAQLLESQVREQNNNGTMVLSEDATPTNVSGNVDRYDPVLISLVRRAMPNLIAYDVCGVQPMTGPTGLIFAMRPTYVTGSPRGLGGEAFYNEMDSAYSGTGAQTGTSPSVLSDNPSGAYTYGTAMDTQVAETLGIDTPFAEMGFEIEKISVEAKSRALKATYSVELAQDLKQIHGLDAETELTNILSAEILAEINREIIRSIYVTAVKGAQADELTVKGEFDLDLDSNGRWSAEKFKGLHFQIDRDANRIAKETRRGRGNFIICSSDVASALATSGMLDYAPALSTDLQVDDTGNTFVGVLNGKYKVFIDPYAEGQFYVIGYKGANAYDAGMYYAPYVPLQLYKAVSDDSFQPKIGFKTRYGIKANPFAEGLNKGQGVLRANTNRYFRRVVIKNLQGAAS